MSGVARCMASLLVACMATSWGRALETVEVYRQITESVEIEGCVRVWTTRSVDVGAITNDDSFAFPERFPRALRLDFEMVTRRWRLGSAEASESIEPRGSIVAAVATGDGSGVEEIFEVLLDRIAGQIANLTPERFHYPRAGMVPPYRKAATTDRDAEVFLFTCTEGERYPARAWRVVSADGIANTRIRILTEEAACSRLKEAFVGDPVVHRTAPEPLEIRGRLIRVVYRDLAGPPTMLPSGARLTNWIDELIGRPPEDTPAARIEPESLRDARGVVARYSAFETRQSFGRLPVSESNPLDSVTVGWFVILEEKDFSLPSFLGTQARRLSFVNRPLTAGDLAERITEVRPPSGFAVVCRTEGTDRVQARYIVESRSAPVTNPVPVCAEIESRLSEAEDAAGGGHTD